jgi:hypothetical protein
MFASPLLSALEDLVGVKDRLGVCERVGGSGWSLAFDEGEGVGAHAEPFEVGSRTLQVDLIAIAAYMGCSTVRPSIASIAALGARCVFR